MLVKGRPMTNFESMSKLLHFFDVKNFPKTHWSNTSGWEMTSCMHDLVVNKTKTLVDVFRFSFSCDEMTTSNQQSWVSIHAYIVENWQWTPLLLCLQRVVDGATFDKLKRILVDAMVLFCDLDEDNIASKLITFGVDEVSIFQGAKIGMIFQLNIRMHHS